MSKPDAKLQSRDGSHNRADSVLMCLITKHDGGHFETRTRSDTLPAVMSSVTPASPGDIVVLDARQPSPVARDLVAEGHTVLHVTSSAALARAVANRAPHVVCTSEEEAYPLPPIAEEFEVVRFGSGDVDLLRVAVLEGVQTARTRRMLRQVQQDTARRLEPKSKLVGSSETMRALIDQVHRVMNVTVPVFLQGESGTGKELVARTIHDAGNRALHPFVALNCASIPEGLQENELFGHERGAFTGAAQAFPGKFEQAHRGTLFLDEIGDATPSVQTRLLRVLQEGTVQRLGGTVARAVDVRVVAASHKDIEALVSSGTFRQDLYFRIVVYPIVVAPLRERRDDIPLLMMHFLRKYASEGDRIKAVVPEALDMFCAHAWPGNVRQLENAVRRAIIASDSDIDVRVARVVLGAEPQRSVASTLAPFDSDEIIPLAELERRAIEHALRVTGGNRALAAKKLGIGRATLHRKLVGKG